MNECTIPIPRPDGPDRRRMEQHVRQVHECKEGEPDVLLIGDSIIQKMVNCQKLWNEVSSLHPLNLGIGGDRVQHVLWRILNGAMDETSPKAIVLHAGTNNHGNTPQEIVEGILKIIEELEKMFPSAHIIFWGLLPRGEYPNSVDHRNMKINELLREKLDGRDSIEIICSGDSLRQADGRLSCLDSFDYLHLTEQGYLKTFTPILQRLKTILNER